MPGARKINFASFLYNYISLIVNEFYRENLVKHIDVYIAHIDVYIARYVLIPLNV